MNNNSTILMINEVYNLKCIKRQGWLRPGRELCSNNVESVSDHSWCTAMLALLLLPNTSVEYQIKYHPCEGYNKDQIIKMLIVHDLAEAYTGDIPKEEKNKQDEKNENDRFRFYKQLNLSIGLKSDDLYSLLEEFSACKTLNSMIAKDIDQLECYLQLYFYRKELIKTNGLEGWKKIYAGWLINLKIKTDFGKEFKNMIDRYFFVNEEN